MSDNTPKDETSENPLFDLLDDKLNDSEDAGEPTARATVSEQVPAFNKQDDFPKEILEEIMNPVAGLQEPMSGDDGSESQTVVQEPLKSLSESIQNVQEGSDMASIFSTMGRINMDKYDTKTDPSFKDILDKFKNCLEDHKMISDNEKFDKFTKMCDCLKEVRDYFENQSDTNDEITNRKKLEEHMESFNKWMTDELERMKNVVNEPMFVQLTNKFKEDLKIIIDLYDEYQQCLKDREPSSSDKEEFDKCTKIFDCLKEVLDYFENRSDTDDEITKRRKFEEHMESLKKWIKVISCNECSSIDVINKLTE